MVGGLEADQEVGLVEGRVVDLVEVQVAEDEASDPSYLRAFQVVSRTVEHLKITECVKHLTPVPRSS